MQLKISVSSAVKPRATTERLSVSGVQRGLRVGGVLLACVALVNVMSFMNTVGVFTAGGVLKIDHRAEQEPQQRLREEEPVERSEVTWAELMAAADATDVSEDQSPPVMKIHYTAKTRAASTEDEWRAINGADVEIYYYSDDDSEALVREWRPQFLQTYRTQLSPVERADYFRYLVLWAFGGVYVDSDITFITPVDQWLSTFGWDIKTNGRTRQLQSFDAIVGVEFPSPQTHYNHTGWLPFQFTQFVIAAKKDSEVLRRVVLHIEECVGKIDRSGDVEMTIERTGPAAFTRAILDAIETGGVVAPHVREMHKNHTSDSRYPRALMPIVELEKTGQLIAWRRPRSDISTPSLADAIGSILVLPYRAFSYHQFHHIAEAPVLTRHMYHNSWRDN